MDYFISQLGVVSAFNELSTMPQRRGTEKRYSSTHSWPWS